MKGKKQAEIEQDFKKVEAAFGTKLFSRHDLETKVPGITYSQATANRRLRDWLAEGKLHRLASAVSDVGTLYSTDSRKAGQRETDPKNRQKYGYENPAKDSGVGLVILTKGLRDDSPAPIERTSAAYHRGKARYDSKKPGSSYKDFGYALAILGHKDELGASEHWNTIGHKQSKAKNQEWNNKPNNYQGPEHKTESAESGPHAPRYIVPNMDIGSHPDWL